MTDEEFKRAVEATGRVRCLMGAELDEFCKTYWRTQAAFAKNEKDRARYLAHLKYEYRDWWAARGVTVTPPWELYP